jgi:hypothetical protein
MITNSKLFNAMEDELNVTYTENGALTLKSTKSSLLDFFSLGGALRTRSESDIINIFIKAWHENHDLALRTLFYLRDIRGGQGERRTFRIILKQLGNQYPDIVIKNFKFIAEMGRYDDFFELLGTQCESQVLEFLSQQIHLDIFNRINLKPVSLLAKWAPSLNTSSAVTRKQALIFKNYLKLTPKSYRKILSDLRQYLKVTEVYMSAGNWSKIDFSLVPSNASKLYSKAFIKHTPGKYSEYMTKVEKGEAKINSSTLYPNEIVGKFLNNIPYGDEARSLEAQWKSLPNYIPDNSGNALVVADVSGSMAGEPLTVSVGLALYMAERNKGLFHNCFMTFESESHLIQLHESSLQEKVQVVATSPWDGSTNLQSVFNCILNSGIKNNLKASDMPDKIYIISDMEFNSACSGRSNFDVIKEKYKASGYSIPTLIFWNVDARNNQSPVKFDENGTMLVSGFSPSIFKNTLLSKVTTPYDLMLEVINQPRYLEIKA